MSSVKKKDREKKDKFILGINGITGSVGRIDRPLPARNKDVSPKSIIKYPFKKEEIRPKIDEWIFKYVNRTYRPMQMPNYEFETDQRYMLYWLIDRGSFKQSYAMNDLTGRRDKIKHLKGIDEYYRVVLETNDKKSTAI